MQEFHSSNRACEQALGFLVLVSGKTLIRQKGVRAAKTFEKCAKKALYPGILHVFRCLHSNRSGDRS